MDCEMDDIPVRLTDSGIAHLMVEDIDPYTLCDMILDDIPCPKKTKRRKKFRKKSIEICSRRNGKIYRILLDESYTYSINSEAYIVTHLEPI